jgi:hypothetical protein
VPLATIAIVWMILRKQKKEAAPPESVPQEVGR